MALGTKFVSFKKLWTWFVLDQISESVNEIHSKILLADRVSIEAQIRTVEVAPMNDYGRKSKVAQVQEILFFRMFRFIY